MILRFLCERSHSNILDLYFLIKRSQSIIMVLCSLSSSCCCFWIGASWLMMWIDPLFFVELYVIAGCVLPCYFWDCCYCWLLLPSCCCFCCCNFSCSFVFQMVTIHFLVLCGSFLSSSCCDIWIDQSCCGLIHLPTTVDPWPPQNGTFLDTFFERSHSI